VPSRRSSGESWASSEGVRRSMQSNRPTGTSVEAQIRSGLHRAGLRFKKNGRPIAGLRCEVDVVFPRQKVAVLVDGCFWHGCPIHATRPVINGDWWAAKLDRNMERDRSNDQRLLGAGWTVLRLWEHEPVDIAVARVVSTVQALKAGSRGVKQRANSQRRKVSRSAEAAGGPRPEAASHFDHAPRGAHE
jgi:DNA mismatch endonuclease (patch repair protein)